MQHKKTEGRKLLYIMDFKGDLPHKAPTLCEAPRVFTALDDALSWLKTHVRFDPDDPADLTAKFWIDPEDDRILIWEATEHSSRMKLVWHFSGWHWSNDAEEHFGGPLEQGKLPGHDNTLYEMAMVEY